MTLIQTAPGANRRSFERGELSSATSRRGHWTAREIAIIFGAWTLIALLSAFHMILYRLYLGQTAVWTRELGLSLADWYTCAALTPLFLWLVRTWPLGRGLRWTRVLFYLGAIAVLVALKYLLYYPIRVHFFPSSDFTLKGVLMKGSLWEFLAFASIIGVAQAIEYHRSLQLRELRASELEARLSLAQLELLTSQLQPHFLFNTLHAISSLMHQDVNAANEMLAQLGDFLRVTLQRSEIQEISLKDELEVLEHYLSIMRIRFGDRLTVSQEVDPRVLQISVPQLLLQPLVENAIKHGVAPHAGPARVSIKAEPVGEAVQISVVDDGPGLAPGAIREGLGLTNTRKRLEQLYGTAAQLTLKSLPRGLEVAVRIPRQSERSPRLSGFAAS